MPRSPSPTVELPRLRAAVDGRVITPDNPGYDQARTIFYGGFERGGWVAPLFDDEAGTFLNQV